MDQLTFSNPLFVTYAIASSLLVLKAAAMSWLTVYRMVRANGGFRSLEDLRKTALNPAPSEYQIQPNDYVDRIRRIQLNDLENLPFFITAAFFYILTSPSLQVTRILLYGYVASRFLHFLAYLTKQTHEVRAACWTIGSVILIYLAAHTLAFAFK